MEDNASLFQFWTKAQQSNNNTINPKDENKSVVS